MSYQAYSEIITDVIVATETAAATHGFKLKTTGGSQVSCSTYFELFRDNENDECQTLTCRISDHPPRGRSETGLHVGLFSDHGDLTIAADLRYSRMVFAEEDDKYSGEREPCEKEDLDAEFDELVCETSEIDRVARAIVERALQEDWE